MSPFPRLFVTILAYSPYLQQRHVTLEICEKQLHYEAASAVPCMSNDRVVITIVITIWLPRAWSSCSVELQG